MELLVENMGVSVLETLRHAADKEETVADIYRTLGNGKLSPATIRELADELERQQEKRDDRVELAKRTAKAGARVRVTTLGGCFTYEGLLVSVNPAERTIGVRKGTRGRPKTIVYAMPSLLDAEAIACGQTYVGMNTVVELEVLSVPEENAYMLDPMGMAYL